MDREIYAVFGIELNKAFEVLLLNIYYCESSLKMHLLYRGNNHNYGSVVPLLKVKDSQKQELEKLLSSC